MPYPGDTAQQSVFQASVLASAAPGHSSTGWEKGKEGGPDGTPRTDMLGQAH